MGEPIFAAASVFVQITIDLNLEISDLNPMPVILPMFVAVPWIILYSLSGGMVQVGHIASEHQHGENRAHRGSRS